VGADQEWLAREGIHSLASFVPNDVQAGYADPPALGYAQVDQRVMERAEGQRVRHLVWALLAVPAHMGRLDGDGMPEGTVEPAHRTVIGIRAQDLLGETAARRAGSPYRAQCWELVGRIEDATRPHTGRMAGWILDWTAGFTWSPAAAAVWGSLRRRHSSRTGPGGAQRAARGYGLVGRGAPGVERRRGRTCRVGDRG
jgi:hypothetical protein